MALICKLLNLLLTFVNSRLTKALYIFAPSIKSFVTYAKNRFLFFCAASFINR